MDELYPKGRSNIAVQRNERSYFFRMFDAKLDAEKIRKSYSWQAYKKLGEKDEKSTDYEIVKNFIGQYDGHFAKVIKIFKIKYILIYFNNERDTLEAIYRSTMDEDMEYLATAATSKCDNFVDAQSSPLSTIPRSKEEHEELDNLNSNFTSRLEEITVNKGKASVKTTDLETTGKDDVNKNKKHVVTTQGRRDDSDSE
ncbi:hypothetical protein RhiirB3_453751 [Rhizophagus irregularis]|nr:hypothetical protein RhiirB3_453751 [Rhizophagus irregularis]